MEVYSQGPMTGRAGRTLLRVALVLLALLALWGTARTGQFNPTDYVAWQNDWTTVSHCLQMDAAPCAGVSKFPLAYLLNAGAAAWAHEADRTMLTALNLAALLIPVLVVLAVQGRRGSTGAIYPYLVAVALSPLPMFYVASGALELQSAVFSGVYLGTFVLAWEDPAQSRGKAAAWIMVFSGLVFPLYKDTVAAVVCVGCLAVIWLRRHELRAAWATREGRWAVTRTALLATGPVVLALIISMQYNALRYDTPLPYGYMEEARQTLPGWQKSGEFLLGSLFSPNGGVLVFWLFPITAALLAWRLEGRQPRRAALVAGVIIVLVSALAFSRWWAPFGWDSWGNRLLIPPAFALLVASLVSLRRGDLEPVGRGKPRIVAALLLLPLLACSFFYALAPYASSPGEAMAGSLWPGPECQRMQRALPAEALAQGMAFWKGEIYYACARERMTHIPKPR